jgi:uncharacterized protein
MRSIACLLPTVALLFQASYALAQTTETPDERYLAVVANAEVRTRPDRATVQLGVETRAETAQAAMARNNEAMDKVLEALRKLGIPNDDLQTSYVSLSPIYTQPQPTDPRMTPPPPQLVGFQATNTVAADVAVDPNGESKVGPAIDAGVTAGANQIQGISFRLSDDQPAKLQALRQAAGRARAKGEALAVGLGVTIDRIDSASEVEYQVIPYDRTASPAPAADGGGVSTPVLPGQLVVRAQVQVKFIIR